MAWATRLLGWAACLLWGLAMGPQVFAQAPDAAASAPTLASLAVQPGVAVQQPPGRVVVMNREIVTLRGSLFGIPAVTRAVEGEQRIRRVLGRGGEMKVETTNVAEGVLVRIDGALMFVVVPEDSEERTLESAQAHAGAAAMLLRRVIDESRESRNLKSLLIAALVTLGAGALMLGLLWLLRRTRLRIQAWLANQTLAHADRLRVGGVDVVRCEGLLRLQQ